MRFRSKLGIVITTIIFTSTLYAFFGEQVKAKIQDLWVELSPEQANTDRIALPSFAPMVKRVEPAILVITTEAVVKQERQRLPPELENSPFRDFLPFFQQQGPQEYKAKGQGSGFIIHSSGLALTNQHVIEGATNIKVKVGKDLKIYDAEVIGSDPSTDVALIRLKSDKKDWPVIPLGSSSNVEVGDFALAIGDPLGLELSVTFGMVSARGRNGIRPSGRSGLYDFIQISNPINPGNSGGPLLNLAGEVIGMNTAISAQGQGIAFAIPINQIKAILPQLKEKGKVARSWLGVQITDVSPELAKASGLDSPHGALVREVMPNSPAKKAGLEAGDIVTEFDGKALEGSSSLQAMAGLAGVGASANLTVYREGKARKMKITLEEMPKTDKEKAPEDKSKDAKETAIEALGLSVRELDAKTRTDLHIDSRLEGVLVSSVGDRSLAQMFGIEANDVIFKVNSTAIRNVQGLEKTIKDTPQGGLIRLYLKRGPSTIFLAINKP